MNNINDGGPAFPNSSAQGDYVEGMSLRDYIASKCDQRFIDGIIPDSRKDNTGITYMNLIAEYRYKFADAMLKAREGK